MDTYKAIFNGVMNQNKELMVFDWDKAARLIKEHHSAYAIAGLAGDMEYTGGYILKDGKPTSEDYIFLASTWAVPSLILDGTEFECYKMAHEVPEWNHETKWPESALKILNE